MGLFRYRGDPIKARERALQEELRQIESQIAVLDPGAPRSRTTSRLSRPESPGGPVPARNPMASGDRLVFEAKGRRQPPESLEVATPHYNEFGVKKLDLIHWWRRLCRSRRRKRTAHSKLVDYLAAGSLQGIRPLRYERRIARNRFLLFFVFLFLILVGILTLLHQGRF